MIRRLIARDLGATPHVSRPAMDTSVQPFDWTGLLAIAVTLAVMILLVRRRMSGMHTQDWLMLKRLRSQRVNFAQPHAVGFITFFDTETRGNTLADRYRTQGFDASVARGQIQLARNRGKPEPPRDGWLVTSTRTMTIDPAEIAKLREFFTESDKSEDGLYLGWQVKPK